MKDEQRELPLGLKVLLTAACCFVLANIYYAQPLIADIASDLGMELSTAGAIVTITQIGYCSAVLFLVPLGDAIENKKLISVLIAGSATTLFAAGICETATSFLIAAFFIGLTSSAVQIVIPMGISLASMHERGRMAGMMMSGAILGIALSRPVSSWLTGLFGWRSIYFLATAIAVCLLVFLLLWLPRKRHNVGALRYPEILASMLTLLLTTKGLRPRLFIMAFVFASFTMFWSTAPLLLKEKFGFSHSDIALFSLASLAAPLCALFAGRMVDRGRGFSMATASIVLIVCAYAISLVFGHYAVSLVAAVFLLDPGSHMTNVVIQQSVLSLDAAARSRLNALCIGFNITGGAVGASLGPWLYSRLSWNSVVWVGALMVIAALVVNRYVKHPAK